MSFLQTFITSCSLYFSKLFNTFFIGINYPSPADAERGLREGVIDEKTFQRIIAAHREGKIPPQNTALGGNIGIHGLGDANPNVHRLVNWTNGCIALDNAQIEELAQLVSPGMLLEIK